MIIDSKGKLFGKISIIDILILIILIGGLAAGGYKLSKAKSQNSFTSSKVPIQFQFYQEEAPDFAVNAIKTGDIVLDPVQNAEFGKVIDIKKGDSISWDNTPKGENKPGTKKGYSSLTIIVDGGGIYQGSGAKVGSGNYYIGQTLQIRAGNAAIYPRISAINPAGK